MRPHSVILIREQEAALTGSGCCGRLEGDFLVRGNERLFPERRAIMEANVVALLLLLLRDFRRFRVGLLGALRTLWGISIPTAIVDGRLAARGTWPSADGVARLLGEGVGPLGARGSPRGAHGGPTVRKGREARLPR
jgi:hypothetical protein